MTPIGRCRHSRARRRPAGARAALIAFFLLVLVTPGFAGAQVPELPSVPDEPPHFEYQQLALSVDATFVEVDYLGRTEVAFTVRDLSRDTTRQPGAENGPAAGPARHTISVTMEPAGPARNGWMASSTLANAFLYGGESVTGAYFVQTAGSVRDQYAYFYLNATMQLRNGSELVESEFITARLKPFHRGLVQVQDPSRIVGQYEDVVFPVEVFNGGAYPDKFVLNVTAPEGFQAHVQPSVYVQPFESRIVNLTLKTPKDKVFDFGTPHTVTVQMKSVNAPTTYESVASLYVRGPYVSKTLFPLTVLSFIAIGVIARRHAEERELRHLERGTPRRPEPTPRTQVVLKELKKRDKDAFKSRKERLDAVYAERRKQYREQHKENARAERDEKKKARVEWKQEKKDRKVARKEARKLEKIERKRQRAHRKVVKKKKRALLKEKKKLEKKRGKLAKRQAKQDARDAKRQAKQDARDAKARAKAEKKAARAARKSEKRK